MRFGGITLETWPPHRIASRGLGRTFQTSCIFKRIMAMEHLLVGRHLPKRSGLWGAITCAV